MKTIKKSCRGVGPSPRLPGFAAPRRNLKRTAQGRPGQAKSGQVSLGQVKKIKKFLESGPLNCVFGVPWCFPGDWRWGTVSHGWEFVKLVSNTCNRLFQPILGYFRLFKDTPRGGVFFRDSRARQNQTALCCLIFPVTVIHGYS